MSDPGTDAGEATGGGVAGETCTEAGGRRLDTTSHELAIVV
ncbi:hypothetical protein [Streptomyces thinghirensis]